MSARSNAGWEAMCSQPKVVFHVVRMTGAGAATPTENEGAGTTLNRTGVGVIEILWPDSPLRFMGLVGHGFDATAQAALKGYSVVAGGVAGGFDTSLLKTTINITDSTNTLVDLALAQSLSLLFAFSKAPATGI